MTFALLFSGQGNQHAGMLPWLADDDGHVAGMCARLGIEDWRRSLEDPQWSAINANAQRLLTSIGLAAWNQLAKIVPSPEVVAGYSVGELAAFSVAGVYDGAVATALAPLRAAAMDRSAAHEAGGLLAISGLAEAVLERLLVDTGLAIAIRNGIESVVLGGPLAALDKAQQIAVPLGAQCTRLRVNIASHTPSMREAAQRFSQALQDVPFQAPHIALFSNWSGDRIRDAGTAKTALAAQIAQTVRWDECMEGIAARQVRCVLELGPGQALTRMWNQRHPHIPARACEDFRSAAAIASWLRTHCDD